MRQIQLGQELPLPPHYKPEKVGKVWRVEYQKLASKAARWASKHAVPPASKDQFKIALIVIDVQNTFCIPGFELFVGGRSGLGAVDDNRRLCEFIYRNLHLITRITASMDTHTAMQIFHPFFIVDDQGKHPPAHTQITYEDVRLGRWKFNPQAAASLNLEPDYGQAHLLHYTQELESRGKYNLTIWPYHSMVSGIGHALVSSIDEALFFHTLSRSSQIHFEIKGSNPLSEHYSILGPEVMDDPFGKEIGEKNQSFIHTLLEFDLVIIAGQAKSHCVAWTIEDLLGDICDRDPDLARKVYLLEDCTSPVVVPGVVDYSEPADAAFRRFAEAGMHLIHSSQPIRSWPRFPEQGEV